MFPIKEEYPGGPSSSSTWPESSDRAAHRAAAEYGPPRPMEGLHDMAPPPFLTKTFDMVDDLSTNHIVSWSRGGHSFVVWDPHEFSTTLLPRYFKHNNFSSFVRQLNTYGFRKIDPDKWEFANEAFLGGQKHLLRNIRRRKATPQPLSPQQQAVGPCVEAGRFGLDAEIDSLRRDKQLLLMELVKLRQQQQNTRAHLQQMEMRLQWTERKQQRMMSFLVRAMQNPDFIHQLAQHKEKRREIEEAVSKKRQRPIEAGGESGRVKAEPMEFGFQVSELEALALEMQGFGRARREETEGVGKSGSYDKELDEGFWEELLNGGFDGGVGLPKDEDEEEEEEEEEEEGEEEDVNVLAHRLGFLSSSPG